MSIESPSTPNTKSKNSKIVLWITNNPWVILIGFICTVASLLFGIYSFYATSSSRDLTFSVNPIKSVALKSGQVSDLKVLFKDKEIKSDITIVQVALWNKGKLPIKADDVLEKVNIITSPPVRILEATIRKQSRKLIDLKMDTTKYDKGILPLSWKILEKNDGVTIQLIYAGSEDIKIIIEGAFEGQPKTSIENSNSSKKTSSEKGMTIRTMVYALLFTIAILLYGLNSMYEFKNGTQKGNNRKHLQLKLSSIIVMFFTALSFVLSLYNDLKQFGPPFGF